ncbi:S8 family serine peptidase [Streptomyces rishiriensis]|uniref:Subtilisin family serine protease n=1 Tax=Streptomyces rishiriensis TaxID=68264 RepID=A0ABU0NWQ9_STRRH|nr:subtilisin family serine protease [Streptomyces rishiriensis]
MARTRTRRLRRVGGLTAVVTSVVLSAGTLPAHAAPEGKTVGAGLPGSVGGSHLPIISASYTSDTGRVTRSGTSMAAPHAAGAAALHLADHSNTTPAQIARALVTGAANGKVSGRKTGAPNKLLQVPPST